MKLCWGIFLAPPIDEEFRETRHHLAYGIVIRRVFLGLIVSWPL